METTSMSENIDIVDLVSEEIPLSELASDEFHGLAEEVGKPVRRLIFGRCKSGWCILPNPTDSLKLSCAIRLQGDHLQPMGDYVVKECWNISSYVCLNLVGGSRDFCLLVHRDAFCNEEMMKNWSCLPQSAFVNHTFALRSGSAIFLKKRISGLMAQLGQAEISEKDVGRGKRGRRAKGKGEPTSSSNIEGAEALVTENIAAAWRPGGNRVFKTRHMEEYFAEHRARYGHCYILGVEVTQQVRASRIQSQAPVIYGVRAVTPDEINDQCKRLSFNCGFGKQTLCLMPANCKSKPTSWEEIKDGEFYPIDGQHIAAAAKQVLKDPKVKDTSNIEWWDAFIIWSDKPAEIKAISEFMNRVNSIRVFKSPWSRNIAKARQFWVEMGRPTRVRSKPKDRTGDLQHWLTFEISLLQELITFNKQGYPVDKKFNDVRNEFKLISCEDRVWKMWEDVFDKFERGELVCPFQGIPFNQIKNYNPSDLLNPEFFKSTAGFSQTDYEDFALYILNKRNTTKNPNRKVPKIAMGKVEKHEKGIGVFTPKKWCERKKSKKVVLMEIDKLLPETHPGLIIKDGDALIVSETVWRRFKKDRNLTSAMMDTFLVAGGKDFLNVKNCTRLKNAALPENLITMLQMFLEGHPSLPASNSTLDSNQAFLGFVGPLGRPALENKDIQNPELGNAPMWPSTARPPQSHSLSGPNQASGGRGEQGNSNSNLESLGTSEGCVVEVDTTFHVSQGSSPIYDRYCGVPCVQSALIERESGVVILQKDTPTAEVVETFRVKRRKVLEKFSDATKHWNIAMQDECDNLAEPRMPSLSRRSCPCGENECKTRCEGAKQCNTAQPHSRSAPPARR